MSAHEDAATKPNACDAKLLDQWPIAGPPRGCTIDPCGPRHQCNINSRQRKFQGRGNLPCILHLEFRVTAIPPRLLIEVEVANGARLSVLIKKN